MKYKRALTLKKGPKGTCRMFCWVIILCIKIKQLPAIDPVKIENQTPSGPRKDPIRAMSSMSPSPRPSLLVKKKNIDRIAYKNP